MDKKLISICIPILNEEENIALIYKKIIQIFNKYKNKYHYEIIFTDNKKRTYFYTSVGPITAQYFPI